MEVPFRPSFDLFLTYLNSSGIGVYDDNTADAVEDVQEARPQ